MYDESTGRPSDAERVFAGYLVARERGERPEFEELCRAHAELTDELRAIRARWEGLQGVLAEVGTLELGGSQAAFAPTDAGVLGAAGPARYEIRDEVDAGGQGVVYRAWDERVRREIAMKVVFGRGEPRELGTPPRVMPGALDRFLEEARITGQLDHPGIVPVHELGLDEDGRAFFTMRLVREGHTFDRVLELVRAGDADWTRARALGVLSRVCEAVAFAHSKGVVHRDLKPQNVMVGRFGETYVMDWGLAKVLGREELAADADAEEEPSPLRTREGQVVGTPAYMPPEQARGELARVGPASDVYSVGAMLYQLLTGCAPYLEEGASRSPRALLERLLREPPRAVEELVSDAPGELVAICGKAMARRPEERYASMQEMADDLRAYLEGRVVATYETGAVAELRKWIQRNRGMAGSIAGAILTLVVGLAGTSWQYVRAEDKALEASRNEQARAAEAEHARDQAARAEREREAADAATDFLVGLFLEASPYHAAGDVPDAIDLLNRGRATVAEAFADNASARYALRAAMAEALFYLGELEAADALFVEATADATALFGAQAEETLGVLRNRGYVLLGLGRVDEAERLIRAAIEGLEAIPDVDPETLATARATLSAVHGARGDDEAALALLDECLPALDALAPTAATTFAVRSNRAALLKRLGRLAESEQEQRAVLALYESHYGPDHPGALIQRNNLGRMALELGRFEEAELLLDGAHEALSRMIGATHDDTLSALDGLAQLYWRWGRYEDALALVVPALELVEAEGSAERVVTLMIAETLANVRHSRAEFAASAEVLEALIPRSIALFGETDHRTIRRRSTLAIVKYRLGAADAEDLFLEVAELAEQHLGPVHEVTLIAWQNLGAFYAFEGRPAEAEGFLVLSAEALEELYGGPSPASIQAWVTLAGLQVELRSQEAAEETLARIAEQAAALSFPPDGPVMLLALEAELQLRLLQERFEEALRLADRMEELMTPEDGKYDWRLQLIAATRAAAEGR